MLKLYAATFVVGSDAVQNVWRELGHADARTRGRFASDGLPEIIAGLERLLRDSPDGFDTICRPDAREDLRLVWQPRQKTAGILYAVRGEELATINLLLSGVSPKADVAAIEEVGRKLSSLDAYFESLAVVRFGARPLLATFCSRTGGLNRILDRIQLAFAGAFLQSCGPLHHESVAR